MAERPIGSSNTTQRGYYTASATSHWHQEVRGGFPEFGVSRGEGSYRVDSFFSHRSESQSSRDGYSYDSWSAQKAKCAPDNMRVVTGLIKKTKAMDGTPTTLQDVLRITTSCVERSNSFLVALKLLHNLKFIPEQYRVELSGDPSPFNACLSKILTCSSNKELDKQADDIMTAMQDIDVTPNVLTCTTLLKIYEKTGNFDAANRLVFGYGETPGDSPPRHDSRRTHVCKNTGQFEPNEPLGFEPDEPLVFEHERIPSRLEIWGIFADIQIYNAYLTLCVQAKCVIGTMRVLDILLRTKMLPNATTVIILLKFFEETGNFDAADRLVFGYELEPSYLDQWRIPINTLIYNAYLGVCARTMQVLAAQRVLAVLIQNANAEQPNIDILPNATTVIILLRFYEETGNFDDADRLVFGDEGTPSYLEQLGIPISIRIYNAYLGVCARTRRADDTLKVLHILIKNTKAERPNPDILPDATACISLLKFYEETEDYDAAYRLVFDYEGTPSCIEQWSVSINIEIINAFLGVYVRTKRADVVQKVLDILIVNANAKQPDPDIFPNAITCVNLLRVYE